MTQGWQALFNWAVAGIFVGILFGLIWPKNSGYGWFILTLFALAIVGTIVVIAVFHYKYGAIIQMEPFKIALAFLSLILFVCPCVVAFLLTVRLRELP